MRPSACAQARHAWPNPPAGGPVARSCPPKSQPWPICHLGSRRLLHDYHRLLQAAENRDAPHQVLQLAHIAGPGMFAQALLGLGIQRLGCLTRRRTLAQEMPGQIDDILAALSQRWQADGNDIEAIEQVLAELALANR